MRKDRRASCVARALKARALLQNVRQLIAVTVAARRAQVDRTKIKRTSPHASTARRDFIAQKGQHKNRLAKKEPSAEEMRLFPASCRLDTCRWTVRATMWTLKPIERCRALQDTTVKAEKVLSAIVATTVLLLRRRALFARRVLSARFLLR
jgi:hypothetical protein